MLKFSAGDFNSVQGFSTYVHKLPSSEHYPQKPKQFQRHWFHTSRERNQVLSIFPGPEKVKAFFNLCDNKLTANTGKGIFCSFSIPSPNHNTSSLKCISQEEDIIHTAFNQLCLLTKVPTDDNQIIFEQKKEEIHSMDIKVKGL